MVRSIAVVVVAALSVVASPLTVPSPSWAGKGGGKSPKTQVQAELAPCCNNPEPEAEGEAERKTISKNGSIQQDGFTAKVEIPVPSAGLGITDATTADIRLVLSRGATEYAECFLVLDQDDDAEGATAEFQSRYTRPRRG